MELVHSACISTFSVGSAFYNRDAHLSKNDSCGLWCHWFNNAIPVTALNPSSYTIAPPLLQRATRYELDVPGHRHLFNPTQEGTCLLLPLSASIRTDSPSPKARCCLMPEFLTTGHILTTNEMFFEPSCIGSFKLIAKELSRQSTWTAARFWCSFSV